MSTVKSKQNTAEAVEKEQTAGTSAPPDAPETSAGKQEEQDKEFFAKLPDPCVYCGPSVRGVAWQYTTYMGGIHEPLKEFIRAHPAARGLIVPTSQFANVRKRLETPGTVESIVYKKVQAEL